LETELINGGRILWSGVSQATVEVNGAVLQPHSEWEEVCWFSDDDVDYLELEMQLESNWRIQRHFCLAREDRFLFVADAVLGPSPGRINYRCAWPLHEEVRFAAAAETREAYLLAQGKRWGLVLPVALPEWRVDQRFGELDSASSKIKLRQSADAQRLFAPLFVDLDPRRLSKMATWRQLTVAQQLAIVSRETAVGYRVQVANDQWLVYRSLTPPTARTVLGQHLSTECLIARIDEEGEADPLVEVEPE
jgi:hypothetical protein